MHSSKIQTSGRTDLEQFFAKSGIREGVNFLHCPALAFLEGDGVTVAIIKDATELLLLSDDTKIMKQWPGQHRSDFFQFTARDLRTFILNNPKADFQLI